MTHLQYLKLEDVINTLLLLSFLDLTLTLYNVVSSWVEYYKKKKAEKQSKDSPS